MICDGLVDGRKACATQAFFRLFGHSFIGIVIPRSPGILLFV
jgi:hypothetical protein